MAHFAIAADLDLSRQHLATFLSMADEVETITRRILGNDVKLVRHVANTQATLTLAESHLDLVRIGGGVFGQVCRARCCSILWDVFLSAAGNVCMDVVLCCVAGRQH